MKKKQFNVFLQEKINKTKQNIDSLNTLKSKLRNEAELMTKNPDTRQELLDGYYKTKKRTIISKIKGLSNEKLITYYIKTKTNEINDKIAEQIKILNELIIVLTSYEKDNFTTLSTQSEIVIKYLIQYGYEEEIPPHELLRQIILLSKISITTEKVENTPMTQYLKALGKLFNESLTYKVEDKKTIEFVLRKINNDLCNEITEPNLNKYLRLIILSLDTHINTLTEEDKEQYKTIIRNNNQPKNKKIQETVVKLNELMNATNEPLQIRYKNPIHSLNEDQLLTIHNAFELIKKEKNKNIVLMVKKAINDIISSSKYLDLVDPTTDPFANDALLILDERIDFLSYMIRTITNESQSEPLFSFLADEKTGYPFIIDDARSMDPLCYPSIFEAINLLDELDKQAVFKKSNITIYKIEHRDIILLFATYKEKIIIITAANRLTESVLTRDYYKIIIEQIKKKYDKKIQTIYSSIVEKELDLSYYLKDERSFIKKKKDK